MRTEETTWLNRKTWRRLVELHATGRITRAELTRLKAVLARPRATPPVAEAAPAPRLRPRLVLVRGGSGGRPPGPSTPAPHVPFPREVA
jgi:hypothetical protein